MKDSDCLKSFQKLADNIFSHAKWLYKASAGLMSTRYDTARLIKATKSLVEDFDPSPENSSGEGISLWLQVSSADGTSTFLYAMSGMAHVF